MGKLTIKYLRGREILDSRANPTLEVEIWTNRGRISVSLPSGASKSEYEALELRDGGKRYQGKGVLKAVKNVNEIIAPRLKGLDPRQQEKIDRFLIELDGTENKKRLGGNVLCAVSIALAKAGAQGEGLSLWKYLAKIYFKDNSLKKVRMPKPCFNIINGGAHAGNDLDFQEFMISPLFNNFSKNLQAGAEIYYKLKEIIKKKYGKGATNVGDEGGFAPPLSKPKEALDLISKAIDKAGYQKKIKIVIDVAASQFFKKNKYLTNFGQFSFQKMADYYLKLISKYPFLGIEDPFAQNDIKGWQNFYQTAKKKKKDILIIGDDLLATNPERILNAQKEKLCNGAIIKINQIGTLSEAMEAVKKAKSFGWKIMVSHRSGDTCDYFIADFAVGIGADFIKSGAPARGERVAKYNRLLKIEQELQE